MSGKPYRLPGWARDIALSYIRAYEELSAELTAMEADIIYATPRRGERYIAEGEERLAFLPSAVGLPGDGTAGKAERLAALCDTQHWQIVHAVDQALFAVVGDMDARAQVRLVEALRLNFSSGRQYPFEYLGLDGVSRRDFYRRRSKALYLVATMTGVYVEMETAGREILRG